MPRTTSRGRAAGIGLGALAAVALVATPVAAATAEEPVVLELDAASPEDLYVSVYGEFGDEDQGSVLRSVPVPESGRVDFTVPAPVGVADVADLSFDVYDVEAAEDADSPEELAPLTLEAAVGVVVLPADDDGVTTLQLTVPLDDPGLVREDGSLVDDVTVSVVGLTVAGLPDTPVEAYFELDLQPGRLAELLVVDPAPVEGYASVELGLQDVSLTAGGSIELVVPEGGVADALGVGTLGYVDAYLYPADDDGWFSWSYSRAFDVISGEAGPLAGAVATGRSDEVLRSAAVEVAAEDELDEDDLSLETTVAADGRSALLTSSETLPGGDYYLSLVAIAEDGESALSASGFAEVEAAPLVPLPEPSPEPTPEPTLIEVPQPGITVSVTATAPAPTATRVAARQNPGLRSNTGVETAAVPGLSDGQLVGLGAGLLVLGSAAGAVALRSQRRARV